MIKKTLKINGVERILILDKDETLAQVLRNHLLLTGCKIGCGEGHCGACNVIMNGKVTRSCIYKMSRVPDNAEITTIEGVGTISDMHPIQVAWMAYGCAQCGFCSPGFIISAKVLLDKPMLTTVGLPKEEMGRFALYLLLDRMKGGHSGVVRMELSGKLLVRNSCSHVSESFWSDYCI